MANSNILVLSATLACLLVMANHGLSQANPYGVNQDELRYNGNNGDNAQLSDENTKPSNNRGNQMKPSSLFGNSGSNENDKNYEDQYEDRPFQRPSTPSRNRPQPFGLFDQGGQPGFGGFFRPITDFGLPMPARPSSVLDDLFGTIRSHTQNMNKIFERQYQDLERQAGEGQDVSYYNRNGVAYVRTCTTKRVSPGNDQPRQPAQVLPIGQEDQQEEQQPQQQQQQQQQQPPQQQQPQQPPSSEEKSQEEPAAPKPSQTS